MIFLFTGTDRGKTRAALNADVEKLLKKNVQLVRISDANTVDDLHAALQGAGMFGLAGQGGTQVVILDSILANEEMYTIFFAALPALAKSSDAIYLLEGKLDADTRKRIEKHAEKTRKFDAPAKGKDSSIFALANALRAQDTRALWVGLQRELVGGKAPEAVHGVLFWGAKDLFMKARDEKTRERAKRLIAELAELPHEARRRGEDLEYALERFALSGV